MNIKNYEVDGHESLTDFLLTPIKYERQSTVPPRKFREGLRPSPYEYEMEGIDNEYPGRAYFLQHQVIDKQDYDDTVKYSRVYSGFEDDFVTLSSELPVPTILKCWAKTYIDCTQEVEIPFRISTPGGIKIWVNKKLQVTYKNYTRNTTKSKDTVLKFAKGSNEVVVYFDDLGERDVDFIFSMINLSDQKLIGHLPLTYDGEKLVEAQNTLSSIYFLKDYYDDGDIKFFVDANMDNKLRIRFNPPTDDPYSDMQSGNITEFKHSDHKIDIQTGKHEYILGNTFKFQFASLTRVEFGLLMPDNSWVTRIITLTVYNTKNYQDVISAKTLNERKHQALEYYAKQNLDDINVAMVKMYLGQDLTYEAGHKLPFELESALKLVNTHGDCSDFILAPLLMFLLQYPNKVPQAIKDELKHICLNFRFWIDEPGNDVMWYFSENHALLFHIARYFAGYLFPDEIFKVSGNTGSQQYDLGKKQIEDWFDEFFEYGLAEWNSLTYMPIDLIGFFSLYNAAPDQNIKNLAKKALDFCFQIIAMNSYGKNYASTYGRVYEHNLKNIALSEIASLSKVAFNIGCFNDALRDVVPFALSDYVPNEKLAQLFEPKSPLKFEYIQGINKAHSYIYKTPEYAMASVINYQVGKHGVQQHNINIALKGMVNNIWITNPGERKFSGDHKPSYWAGNNRMPQINQYHNYQFMTYNLTDDDLQFIHMYYPFWDFDEEKIGINWVAFRKGNAAGFVHFSNPIKQTEFGPETKREFISSGRNHFIFLTCFEVNEKLPSEKELMDRFQIDDSNKTVEADGYHFEVGNQKLVVNGTEVPTKEAKYLKIGDFLDE
ncbi:hypothetical protein [Lactobacillus sp. ESL0703]|uniref:hypothetical protein n=1 Tax=Lactobacillus sp. ESL0703 TaxID=2983218 RepID=UPI0023F85973|nr:hypothetical protein [Lactobacillus sp. ESL0703]MDF7669103.1 hypothetical protein [Lactobacillus sp. ESL0703]